MTASKQSQNGIGWLFKKKSITMHGNMNVKFTAQLPATCVTRFNTKTQQFFALFYICVFRAVLRHVEHRLPYFLESNPHPNLIRTSFCRFLKRKKS